ncbi:mitochondrial ribosomal protein s19 [Zymoseptoria brevis]|uniref:Small ribosomal subunit protein uS19m n=1 Tax=Zymoseptoria brevis TaxID=1047168 RepID=A0A0F4GV66_9PEZI|nr:mitochondrial ribosomal protein s19 [Zymoseptoria brevis]
MKVTAALFGRRSVWKGPHVVPLPIIRAKAGERTPPVKTQARSATILPNFVGLVFQVHNGKIYNDVRITEDMVGHKLGEFSATRKRFTYKQTKNK